MDFRRSTIVLIIGFFLLDLFLFGIFWQMRNENRTPLNTSINVLEQIRNDGITVNGLSSNVESLPIIQMTPTSLEGSVERLPLNIQNVTYDRGIITSQLLTPIQLNIDSENITADSFSELTDFVGGGSVVRGNQYSWFSYNPTTRKVIYTQIANRVPVIDGSGQIVFTLNANQQVISYEQTFAGDFSVLGNSRSLITSQRAMEILYLAGRVPSRSTVSMIRLSYYQSLTLNDLSIYSPAWYVEFRQSDGQIASRRVDAIRGTVLTNDTVESVNTTATQ